NKKCLVVGSSWPEDISVMKNWLNSNSQNEDYKVIIAPHEVHSNAIKQLIDQLDHPVQLYSEIEKNKVVEETTTLIIDSIGKLTLAYSYASIAYVGGAMGTKGLHNILEAATFGIPVVIGKNYEKFPEAGKLEDLGGLFSIENKQEFNEIINKLFEDDYLRDKTGMISGHWINSNTGATRLILNYLKEYNEDMVVHN
ncbi:MAG: 3-deoxy-D-manno-octulosonic acid transferase, partial [Bacteroidota bacterium]|nr:3-deoxy-D-manno-octulosonic acid transferase [Bacteroidota bacterium]